MAGKKLRSIRNHLFRHGRALDVARWNYHFEDGSVKDVLKALAVYRNSDGGFGHGIEPDNQNPHSTPIGTWVAVRVLREMSFPQAAEQLMQDMHTYLVEADAFDGIRWARTVPSNNDWPHAPWWEYNGAADTGYHPTAELAGFLLRTAKPGSRAYVLAEEVIRRMMQRMPTHIFEGHELANFTALLEDVTAVNREDILAPGFAMRIAEEVHQKIEQNPGRYTKHDYIVTPKYYIDGKQSPYFEQNRSICEFYADFLEDTVEEDGAWVLNWQWGKQEMLHNAHRDWQGSQIVDNMLYLQGMKPELITIG